MNQEWKLENNLKHIQNLLNPMQAECSDLKEHILAMQFYIRQRCVDFASIIKKVNSKGEDRTIQAQLADLETLFHLLKEDVQDGQTQVQEQLKQISMTTESLKIYESKLNSATELLQVEKKNLQDSCAAEITQSLNLLEEQRRINREQHKQFFNENKQLTKLLENKDQEIQQLKSLNLYIRNNLQNVQSKCKEEVQFIQSQMNEQVSNLNKKIKKIEDESNYQLIQLTEQSKCKYDTLKSDLELEINQLQNTNYILQNEVQNHINKLNHAMLDVKTSRQNEEILKDQLNNQNQRHQAVIKELRDQNNQLKTINQQLINQNTQTLIQLDQLKLANQKLDDQLLIKDSQIAQLSSDLRIAEAQMDQHKENDRIIYDQLVQYCNQMKFQIAGDNITILNYAIKRAQQTFDAFIDAQEINQDLKNQIEYQKLECEKQLHHLKDENQKLNNLVIDYGQQIKDTIFNRTSVISKEIKQNKSIQCIISEETTEQVGFLLMGSISNMQSSSDINTKSLQSIDLPQNIQPNKTEMVICDQKNPANDRSLISTQQIQTNLDRQCIQNINSYIGLNEDKLISKPLPQLYTPINQKQPQIKVKNKQKQEIIQKYQNFNTQTQTNHIEYCDLEMQTDTYIDLAQQQQNDSHQQQILQLKTQLEQQKLYNKQKVNVLSRQIDQLLDQQSQLHKQYQILEYEKKQHKPNIQKNIQVNDQETQTLRVQDHFVDLKLEQQEESEKQSLQDQNEPIFLELSDQEESNIVQIELEKGETINQQTTIYPTNVCDTSHQQTLNIQEPLRVPSSKKSRRIQIKSIDIQEKESTVIKQQLLDIGQQYVTQYSNNFELLNQDQTIDMYHPYSTRHQNMRQQSKDKVITQLRLEVDKLRKQIQSLKQNVHSDIRGKSLETCDINELRVQFTQHQQQANCIIRYLQNEIENYKNNYNLFNSGRNEYVPNDPILQTRTKMAPNSPKRIFQPKKTILNSEIKFPRTLNPTKRNHSLHTNPIVSYEIVQKASNIVKSLRTPQRG